MGIKALVGGLLSGIAQIVFLKQRKAGGFFLAGIALFSPLMAFTCLAGTSVATATAIVTKRSPEKITEGLYGFNGALLGLALPVFLPHTLSLWLFLVTGAALTTLLYEMISSRIGAPPLTLPYVLLTWLCVKLAGSPPVESISEITSFWNVSLLGMGQIFFLESILGGIVILVGIASVSLRLAVWAWVGACIGSLPVFWSDQLYTSNGLITLNTALCVLAFLHVKPEANHFFVVGIAALSVFMYPALYTSLAYFSLPALTFPFIVCTWAGMLLLKRVFIVKGY